MYLSNHSVMAGDKGDPDSQESTQPSAAAGTETPTSGPVPPIRSSASTRRTYGKLVVGATYDNDGLG